MEIPTDGQSKWAGFAFGGLMLAALAAGAGPAQALALGAVWALIWGNPFPRHGKTAGKYLLQACVVLLGFQVDFYKMLRVGAGGWCFAALTILTTFALGALTGRWLKLQGKTTLLISAGTAICGGSAIAAVGPVVGAGTAEMVVSMGAVFLLNGVALYLFPLAGHWLHLSPEQFGLWSGIAIHDISSVVGAASLFGDAALQTATAVKLSRTLWIVPITLCVAYFVRRRARSQGEPVRIAWPWFIGLFVLASLAGLVAPGVHAVGPVLTRIARLGFTLTLFLVGAGLTRQAVRAVGWKALFQGVCLWAFISVASLLAILYF